MARRKGDIQQRNLEKARMTGASCSHKDASLTVCCLISTYSCEQHIGRRSMMGARTEFEWITGMGLYGICMILGGRGLFRSCIISKISKSRRS